MIRKSCCRSFGTSCNGIGTAHPPTIGRSRRSMCGSSPIGNEKSRTARRCCESCEPNERKPSVATTSGFNVPPRPRRGGRGSRRARGLRVRPSARHPRDPCRLEGSRVGPGPGKMRLRVRPSFRSFEIDRRPAVTAYSRRSLHRSPTPVAATVDGLRNCRRHLVRSASRRIARRLSAAASSCRPRSVRVRAREVRMFGFSLSIASALS